MPSTSLVVVARWGEIVASTIRGIHRIIFYGAPPTELIALFSVWPTDVLLISLAGDHAAMRWMPEPLHMWRCFEEANMATPAVFEQDLMLSASASPLYRDAVTLASPIIQQPPSYAEATSSVTWLSRQATSLYIRRTQRQTLHSFSRTASKNEAVLSKRG